jgi:hypothetical protein
MEMQNIPVINNPEEMLERFAHGLRAAFSTSKHTVNRMIFYEMFHHEIKKNKLWLVTPLKIEVDRVFDMMITNDIELPE